MKRYIRSDIDYSEYIDDTEPIEITPGYILWNISWWDQRGNQCGESLEVKKDEKYPGIVIERYLIDKYGDDYGGIADYMGFDDEGNYIAGSTSISRYSDVRPYADRKYWYFTTHGIGPGTIPKDLNVLEVKEGQNEKGTWGDYICLDGVLNTSELEKYDLRELAPPDSIESAEDYDTEYVPLRDIDAYLEEDEDEDEWDDVYQGHKYRVDGKDTTQIKFFDDPEKAIQQWFKWQKDDPTNIAILSPTRANAIELVKAATPQLLTGLYAQYDCPYKLDWLISEAEKQVENGCRFFYEGSYGYGDTIHPFGVG